MHSLSKWSLSTSIALTAVGLLATSALAAQNVANTAQKGSLLIFPLIDVRAGTNTIIRIANDANAAVDVKCYYVNQTKFRNDFAFKLTKKQAVTWDAVNGISDPFGNLQPFPTALGPVVTGPYAGNPLLGELICFAVNAAGSAQISHNHLSGTATVVSGPGAYEYNSWNFTARGVPQGRPVGIPGRLDLTGADHAYDACPLYNIVHFSPTRLNGVLNDQRIGVSTCAQDLRQDFTPHFTKLQVNFWNAHEVKFTGAWECSNSTDSFLLSELDVLPQNASRRILGTSTAHAQIRGVASTQCPFSEHVGIVAVSARVQVAAGVETPGHGTTANHAGASPIPGYVLWDPQDDSVPEAPRP